MIAVRLFHRAWRETVCLSTVNSARTAGPGSVGLRSYCGPSLSQGIEALYKKNSDSSDNVKMCLGNIMTQENPSKHYFFNSTNSRIACIQELISSYGDAVDWDKIESLVKELHNFNIFNNMIGCYIFQQCRLDKLYHAAGSYFKYLLAKKKLSQIILNEFCNIMIDSPGDFTSFHKLIYDLGMLYGSKQESLLRICLKPLFYSPAYYKLCLKHSEKISDNTNIYYHVVCGALLNNDIQTALKYLRYCKDGMQNLINNFVEYFHNNGIADDKYILEFMEILCLNNVEATTDFFDKLFAKMDKVDEKFTWFVGEVKAIKGVCSYCSGLIPYEFITDKEIEVLRDSFEKDVVYQSDLNLRSHKAEWNKFVNFLDKASYNIVFDELNILHCMRTDFAIENLLSEIEKFNLSPLVLGRKHVKRIKKHKFFSNFPTFLTDNMSDDDVYIIYAALCKGNNCFTLTLDKMRFCNTSFESHEMALIFKKWQVTHQCKALANGKLLFPEKYMGGFRKSSSNNEKEFRIHNVVTNDFKKPSFYCFSRIKRNP